MTVEKIINIQEETSIIIRLIRKVQISEKLALERSIRRIITDTFPR